MRKKLMYYVDGQWKESKTEKYMPVTDSNTGQVIAEAPCCTKEEVIEAIQSAQQAYPEWLATPISQRVQVMYKYKALLEKHQDELALLISTEQGKTLRESKGEIVSTIADVEFACGAPWLSQGEIAMDVSAGHDIYRIREPLGVFAGIAPSNFPAMIPFGWMIPLCITLGNTMVLKAASLVPTTGIRLMELLIEAGLPKGVVNFVTCSRNEAEIFLSHPAIRGVTYVGSSSVGKHIYATAAANGKRVQAMGEAKNHAVVLKDCELELTAHRIVTSCYGAAGQRCQALPVVCVEEEIADQLIPLIVKFAKDLQVGPAYEPCRTLGPVITAEHKKYIIDWINQGIEEGAELILDGRTVVLEGFKGFEEGYYVGPTILDYVKPGMSVGEKEIFGPVLCIKRVKDFEEGLAIANANEFANGAVLFTQNGMYAREFIMRSHAGSIGINIGIPAVAAGFPFSGHKESFYGDLHAKGRDAIAFFTESKCVTTKWFTEEDNKNLSVVQTIVKCGQ